MCHPFFILATAPILLLTLFGCATGDSLDTKTAPPLSTAREHDQSQRSFTDSEYVVIIKNLKTPIPFDNAFSQLQSIPRAKTEFETTDVFARRQEEAQNRLPSHFLIDAPLDIEYVKYDADKQTLTVAIYALTNTHTGNHELRKAFGHGSELYKAGTQIEYSFNNIAWALPLESRNIGTYNGSNSFGANVIIVEQERVFRGAFERRAKKNESLWFAKDPDYIENSPPIIFEIQASPAYARSLKQTGLRAAMLIAPKPPFHAVGTGKFLPTIRAPYDRTTEYRFIVCDILCAAVYDANGKLLATRITQ